MVSLDYIGDDYSHRIKIQEILTLVEDILDLDIPHKDIEFLSNRLNGILNSVENKSGISSKNWPYAIDDDDDAFSGWSYPSW
jgi:hypothetical protein